MRKYLVLYEAPVESFEKMMKETTPEKRKAFMDAWQAWATKAASQLVDLGAPLGKALKVTSAGASATRNTLGGYSIMQGESKESVAEALKGHPHFQMPDAFIEVVELMPM
jgi:hypothetical protein